MADTVRVKNQKSGVAFDLPKDKYERIKGKEAGVNLVEVSAKEKSDPISPSVVADVKTVK